MRGGDPGSLLTNVNIHHMVSASYSNDFGFTYNDVNQIAKANYHHTCGLPQNTPKPKAYNSDKSLPLS